MTMFNCPLKQWNNEHLEPQELGAYIDYVFRH